MFPPSSPAPTLRARLVRSLDLAVEFATLGEYGVEEVEVVTELPGGASHSGVSWDWPERCGEGRSRSLPGAAQRPRRPL